MIRLRKSAFTPPRLNPLLLQIACSCRTSKLLLLSCPTSADISWYGTPMARTAKRPDFNCAKEKAVGAEDMGGFQVFHNELNLSVQRGRRNELRMYRARCLGRERIPQRRNRDDALQKNVGIVMQSRFILRIRLQPSPPASTDSAG